jgi:hypothetical protein
MSTKADIYRPSMSAFVGFASHNMVVTPAPLAPCKQLDHFAGLL